MKILSSYSNHLYRYRMIQINVSPAKYKPDMVFDSCFIVIKNNDTLEFSQVCNYKCT